MPRISHEELERLQADSERAAQYDGMAAIIGLANILRDDLIHFLEENPDATTAEVGDLAYRRVRESEIEAARDEVVTQYEQRHRQELYSKVVEEVRKEEGDAILESVRKRIETDPELAVQLRDSARKELAARAMNVVQHDVSEHQSIIIDREAERQITLDKLDVELAIEGELDLHRDDIRDILQLDDRLVLFLENPSSPSEPIELVLRWAQDVNNDWGWVYVRQSHPFLNRDGYRQTVPEDRFIHLGSAIPNLSAGTRSNVPNLLRTCEPIALMTEAKNGDLKTIPTYVRVSGYDRYPGILRKTDFQTRTLHFND